MTAIAKRIEHRLNSLPAGRAARLAQLLEELLDLIELDEPSEASVEATRRKLALEAMTRLAGRGGIAGTDDPETWQRELRNDHALPGREL